MIDVYDIIAKWYTPATKRYEILVEHSEQVAGKACAIVDAHPEWGLDRTFVYEAAMLHDIGIDLCDAPDIECYGDQPYIMHGVLGAERLRALGMPLHARVCERHTGTGVTLATILEQGWGLEHRDYLPVTLAEQVICFADKFYSKSGRRQEKSLDKIIKGLERYGEDDVERFRAWCALFL